MTKTMMQTYTGRVIDLADFKHEDVCIEDIAHALSCINRYTGHARFPYSVASHSVHVSRLLKPPNDLWGLLHDASEAYLGDLSRPLKTLLPDYRSLESHVMRVIAQRFGLRWPMPSEVAIADDIALMTEKRDILTVEHDWEAWTSQQADQGHKIEFMTWQQSQAEFLKTYSEIVQW